MGQYYKCVNLDKQEVIVPWSFNNGAKLMEHSWVGNCFMNAAMNLLWDEWAEDRIVWAGDYGDEGLFLNDFSDITYIYKDEERTHNLYSYATEYFKEIKADEAFDQSLRYIVNHSQGVYVDLEDCPPTGDTWFVHPLSILTSSGCGRGGGDFGNYRSVTGADYVGNWAGDSISTEVSPPENFKKTIPNFAE